MTWFIGGINIITFINESEKFLNKVLFSKGRYYEKNFFNGSIFVDL